MDLVPDLIGMACARFPRRTAVVAGERALTFAELDDRADRLAGVLAGAGIGAGDRVAVISTNRVEYLEIQVAAMRVGAVLVPLNFRLAVPELSYIVGNCRPSLLLAGEQFVDAARALDVPWTLPLGPEYEAVIASSPRMDARKRSARASAPSMILYTSGTTGRPKGAVISNHALFARINANLFEYGVSAEDRFLQCLPLFHISSNVSSTYAYAGATQVLLAEFDPEVVLDSVQRHGITAALLVPTMINAVVNYPEVGAFDLTSLRTLAYGASPIPVVVLERAISVLGCEFVQLFGMTETNACTVLRRADHRRPHLLASAGTEAIGFEVRVVDEADDDVETGAVGEVVCRGPALMDGYWMNDEASAEALRGGWMHTGDLGYRDPDGYLFVTDRKKDMIVTGGENVYPREVEDVLFEHPDVLEAAVIGVPDERWGERVHAVLVCAPDATLDEQAVLVFARERLAAYKVPKTAEVMAELPKNATGKVLKTELRAPYWEGRSRSVG
jgi:acyl-CoA synthetase (AMP-forming)/AMP-acid ligase II